METIVEKEYICKFCNKKFPSGKSLGGHIRIHTNEYSLHSSSYNGKKSKKKRLVVDQREITAPKHQQLCCRECGKGFDSLKDLWSHMDCCHCEGEKLVMDTETTSSGSTRKRSKKQSSSESFSIGSSSSSFSSACEIDQEDKNTALSLMMLSMDSSKGLTFVLNSLVAEILETNLSSGEHLKMIFNVSDNDVIHSDSYSSDSDYFMNGPKKSDSAISVDGCPMNTGFNKSLMVKKAISVHKKKSKSHECPICFRVFKSGQALGGHKRSHFLGNHEHTKL